MYKPTLIIFANNTAAFTDSDETSIQIVGVDTLEEIDVSDFGEDDHNQMRSNLANFTKLNQILQKRGKHISMKSKGNNNVN